MHQNFYWYSTGNEISAIFNSRLRRNNLNSTKLQTLFAPQKLEVHQLNKLTENLWHILELGLTTTRKYSQPLNLSKYQWYIPKSSSTCSSTERRLPISASNVMLVQLYTFDTISTRDFTLHQLVKHTMTANKHTLYQLCMNYTSGWKSCQLSRTINWVFHIFWRLWICVSACS